MAKLDMLKVSVCGLKHDRKTVLEAMQRLGTAEIEQIKNDEGTFTVDTSQQRDSFQGIIAALKNAVEILDECQAPKSSLLASFTGRPEMSDEEFSALLERSDRNISRCYEIIRKKKLIEEQKAEIVRLGIRIDALNPWLGLDVSMRLKGTDSTRAFVGTLPGGYTRQSLLETIAAKCPNEESFDAEVISNSAGGSCIFVLALKSEAETIENALRALGFARPPEMSKNAPKECQAELRRRQEECEERIKELRNGIEHYLPRRALFLGLLDYYSMRLEKYENIERLAHTEHTFIIEGWIPQISFEQFEEKLTGLGAYVEVITPGKKENPPVLLRNGPITEGGEPIVELYSLPSKRDIDPTPVMSIFYYALFGLMLSDAAYGLLMVIACAFVLLKCKPEGSGKKNIKLFMFSGACAIVWGLLFGSVFGDLINVVAHTFFGVSPDVLVLKPLWFDPIINPVDMMLFSIGVGIIHVLTGMILGLITNLKNKDFMGAFADSLSWILFIVGLLLAFIEPLLGIFGKSSLIHIPQPLKTTGLGMIVFSIVVILFFAGRSSKSPGKRLLKGAYSLYGATSYLSDFLSYSRLLALGLATGVISQVFNSIGSLAGGGLMGAVLMIVVCVVGHALNIGISLIGCYVHACRLQYVEFFGKFYEGGGRAFRPFSAKTKSFKLKEEK